jgi:mRNA interferase MazF
VVSPDETNRHLNTVVVVPLTTAEHPYAFRLDTTFLGRRAQCAVDQVRVIDKTRLLTRTGALDEQLGQQLMALVRTYFT